MGYCANFNLPRPLCSRLRPDVRDRRQTDRRQSHIIVYASALWGRGHNNSFNIIMARVTKGILYEQRIMTTVTRGHLSALVSVYVRVRSV